MTAKDTRRDPGAAEIRSALERIVASSTFERSDRAQSFLRFVVEETLAGRSDILKGFTIAVEVFGKTEDFDAQQDPLVRVEARRLRQRLLEYYTSDGANDPIRIGIPLGQYVPTFEHVGERAKEPHQSATTQPRRHRRRLWATAIVVLAGIALFALPRMPNDRIDDATGADVPTQTATPLFVDLYPRLVVLPIENLTGEPQLDEMAIGLTEEINLALVAASGLTTATATTEELRTATLEDLRQTFAADYVLDGSLRSDGGQVRVTARLIETTNGTQLWSDAQTTSVAAAPGMQLETSIAVGIARLLSVPDGPLFEHESQLTAGIPPAELNPYQCLMRFYGYVRSLARRDHADTSVCMERAVLVHPELAQAWGSLAVLTLHEHTYGYTPQPDRPPALERALEAARRALETDSSDRTGAVALLSVLLATGDRLEYLRAVDRALALEPSEPRIRAIAGYTLVLSGDWERGVPLIEEAMSAWPGLPGWYHAALSFRFLQTDRYTEALEMSLRIGAPEWYVSPMTVAACAALAGDMERAEREARRLLELYPGFEGEGRERLARLSINDALRERLIAGLELAGLDLG